MRKRKQQIGFGIGKTRERERERRAFCGDGRGGSEERRELCLFVW
jgi:hypothetical protein